MAVEKARSKALPKKSACFSFFLSITLYTYIYIYIYICSAILKLAGGEIRLIVY